MRAEMDTPLEFINLSRRPHHGLGSLICRGGRLGWAGFGSSFSLLEHYRRPSIL